MRGLLLSQALTLYTTPVVCLYMDRLRSVALQRHAQVMSECLLIEGMC